jgi:LysM repeat protein
MVAHEDPAVALMAMDSIHIDVEDDSKYLLHTMQTKETLYSTARLYQCSLADIYNSNEELKERLVRVNEVIRIPLMDFEIATATQKGPLLIYIVKPKETLFRIARIHFDLTIEEIKVMNHLESNDLNVGQKLIIGVLRPVNIETATEEITPDTTAIVNSLPDMEGFTWIERKNIAYWLKDASPSSSMIVLHNSAPVNSQVEVTNPMYGKTVIAKVIGRIPDKAYPSDIDIILSRAVADELGAIDSRFYVKVRYLK